MTPTFELVQHEHVRDDGEDRIEDARDEAAGHDCADGPALAGKRAQTSAHGGHRASPVTSPAWRPDLGRRPGGRFSDGGENLAVDLADSSLVTVTAPPIDLIAGQAASDRFWDLHDAVLPEGWALPAGDVTRRLRDAVRTLLDAAQQGAALDAAALKTVNATSALARVSVSIAVQNGFAERREGWQYEDPRDIALASAAGSAIDVLTDPALRANLRRCASPTCSMLFVNGDARRRWCAPNIFGNRDRVARHYRRRLQDQR